MKLPLVWHYTCLDICIDAVDDRLSFDISSANNMNRIPSLSAYQPPSSTFPLTLLSWNISNAKPSFSAPNIHQRAQDAPRLIREECLRYTPDIIALQECPYPQFGTEEFTDDGYISAGTQQSHCGYSKCILSSFSPTPKANNYHVKVAARV